MPDPKLDEAHQLRISGQYDQAAQAYEAVLCHDSDCAAAWWGLAHCTFNHIGDFDAAQQQFEKACAMEPDNTRFMLDLAMYFTMLGMFEDAKPWFEKIVAAHPDSRECSEAEKQLSYYH